MRSNVGISRRRRLFGLLLIAFVAFLSMPLGSEGAHTVSSVLPALRPTAGTPRSGTEGRGSSSVRTRDAERRPESLRLPVPLHRAIGPVVAFGLVFLGWFATRLLGQIVPGGVQGRAPPIVV